MICSWRKNKNCKGLIRVKTIKNHGPFQLSISCVLIFFRRKITADFVCLRSLANVENKKTSRTWREFYVPYQFVFAVFFQWRPFEDLSKWITWSFRFSSLQTRSKDLKSKQNANMIQTIYGPWWINIFQQKIFWSHFLLLQDECPFHTGEQTQKNRKVNYK